MESGLSPGTLLQFKYLRNRLKGKNYKYFIEMGSGCGGMSRELLNMGLRGCGYDLNKNACVENLNINQRFIVAKKYNVKNENFLTSSDDKADIVLANMVLEHLTDKEIENFFLKTKISIFKGGKLILFLPAGMKYWGIEDEIAGHLKRYERDDVINLVRRFGFKVDHMVGLTYPLSNMLLPISNFLVKKYESNLLSQSLSSRTIYSGNRNVPFKAKFPFWYKFIVNDYTIYPFYLLQKLFLNSKSAMVLYVELSLD